jgi:hypothetical protein
MCGTGGPVGRYWLAVSHKTELFVMIRSAQAFSLPAKLSAPLQRVLFYWRDLKRGENEMPFADDVDLSGIVGTCSAAAPG